MMLVWQNLLTCPLYQYSNSIKIEAACNQFDWDGLIENRFSEAVDPELSL